MLFKLIIGILLNFNLYGLEVKSIHSVYDGDTFKVNLDCNEPLFCNKLPIRVYGIDTPEKRGSSNYEKQLAHKARDITYEFVHKPYLQIDNCFRGKYFRVVCEVHRDNIYLKDILLENELAVPYYGGTKSYNWDSRP